MNKSGELARLFKRDLKRLAEQVSAFPDDATLWRKAPGFTNAAGNLVLHLEGNLREYIGRQMGGIAYERERDLEFSSSGATRAELVARVEDLIEVIPAVLEGLPDEVLAREHPEVVLDASTTTAMLLMSLLAHLNYHLGQIDTLRRVLSAGAAVSYSGLR